MLILEVDLGLGLVQNHRARKEDMVGVFEPVNPKELGVTLVCVSGTKSKY